MLRIEPAPFGIALVSDEDKIVIPHGYIYETVVKLVLSPRVNESLEGKEFKALRFYLENETEFLQDQQRGVERIIDSIQSMETKFQEIYRRINSL